MTHADRPTPRKFRSLIPSDPIALPFRGDYQEIKVVYNLDRVMALDDEYEEIMLDLLDSNDALLKQIRDVRATFYETWTPLITREVAASESYEARLAQIESILGGRTPDDSAKNILDRMRIYIVDDTAEAPTEEDRAQFHVARQTMHREQRRLNDMIDSNSRAIALRIIAYCVAEISWPFTDAPPIPTRAETFVPEADGGLSDRVIHWIAGDQEGMGRALAKAQMRSPLSNGN